MSWDEFGMVMIANDYAFKTDLNLILISAESSQMIHSHTVSYSMWTQTLLRLKRRVTSPSLDSESILQSRHPHKSEVHKSETRRIWFSPKSFQGKLFHSKIFYSRIVNYDLNFSLRAKTDITLGC